MQGASSNHSSLMRRHNLTTIRIGEEQIQSGTSVWGADCYYPKAEWYCTGKGGKTEKANKACAQLKPLDKRCAIQTTEKQCKNIEYCTWKGPKITSGKSSTKSNDEEKA